MYVQYLLAALLLAESSWNKNNSLSNVTIWAEYVDICSIWCRLAQWRTKR